MMATFCLFLICVAIKSVGAFLFPEPLKEEAKDLVWENWMEPLRAKCGSGLSDYRIQSVIVILIFAALYITFR
jgi:hypothetical protein